jgi:uncharacterized membrane protein YgcG
MQEILKDFMIGEHILLVGNQGVGKNKVVDYILQRLNLPREYIQLHRDTTVSGLTSCPTIVDGFLTYEDSPLVKAAKNGYILVIDEADKAPIHVTSILKTLVEDGEMLLVNGNRLSTDPDPEDPKSIQIHPDFRMFVLANRPGYPFLGNNFFASVGDVFATHCVDNPDALSEFVLLKSYGPNVPDDVLNRLISAFSDLRKLVDEGSINYPYSTRELVNIVKHLQAFPKEGVSSAVKNVFDFDTEIEISKILVEVMTKNGIPLARRKSDFEVSLAQPITLPAPVLIEKWTPTKSMTISQGPNFPLKIRGSWKLDVPHVWGTNGIKNERSTRFSEVLYSFNLSSMGSFSDMIVGVDGRLYAITIAPVHLHVLSDDHKSRKVIDLYEYIPSNRGVQLSMYQLPNGILCVHNSQEHSLLFIDLVNSLITTALIQGMDPTENSVVAFKNSMCFAYQRSANQYFQVDLNSKQQTSREIPFSIENIFVLEDQLLILSKAGDRLRVAGDKLIPLQVSDCYKSGGSSVRSVGDLNHEQSWMSSDRPSMFGSISSCEGASTAWYAWLREKPLRKSPFINLMPVSGCLYRTEQLVHVCPWENAARSMVNIELLNYRSGVVRSIELPVIFPGGLISESSQNSKYQSWAHIPVVSIAETPDSHLVMMDQSGKFTVIQVNDTNIQGDLKEWSAMTGGVFLDRLKLVYDENHPEPSESVDAARFQTVDEVNGAGNEGTGSGDGEGEGEGSGSGGESGSGSGGGPANPLAVEARKSGTIDGSFQLV